MDVTTSVEPVTNLKSQSAALIRKAHRTGQPIIITQNGKPSAVLIDVEIYQRQRNALLLLKICVQGDQDYHAGRVLDHENVKKRFLQKLAEATKNSG